MPMLLYCSFRSLHQQLLHCKDANAHPCMDNLYFKILFVFKIVFVFKIFFVVFIFKICMRQTSSSTSSSSRSCIDNLHLQGILRLQDCLHLQDLAWANFILKIVFEIVALVATWLGGTK